MNLYKIHSAQQPQFTAIRKIKCNATEFVNLTKEFPNAFSNGTRTAFISHSPEHVSITSTLFRTAKKEGHNIDWLLLNCKAHNIKIPKPPEFVYEFTDSSIIKLLIYSLKSQLALVVHTFKNANKYFETLPKHLIDIKLAVDFANLRLPKFEKFLKKNNVEEISLEEYRKILAKFEH